MVDTAPQSTAERGYAASDSRVDWDAQIVTCPQGKRGHRWSVENNRHGHPIVRIRFSVQDRGPCPVRELCIRPGSHGRTLTLLSRAEDEALTSARCEQKPRHGRRSIGPGPGLRALSVNPSVVSDLVVLSIGVCPQSGCGINSPLPR